MSFAASQDLCNLIVRTILVLLLLSPLTAVAQQTETPQSDASPPPAAEPAPAAQDNARHVDATSPEPTQSPKQEEAKQEEDTHPATKDQPKSPIFAMKDSPQKAWAILRDAVTDRSTEKRSSSIRALSLIPNNSEAVSLAEKGLTDDRPEVRSSAAFALGEMRSRRSIPKLRRALNDKELPVVLAAANALKTLRDPSAYAVYYAVLTGDRKSGKGLLAEQEKMLHDPKKIMLLGVQEGVAFIPFGGMGFTAIKMLAKDDSSPVRAAAAKALAKDPDPKSARALKDAVLDKSWIVRAAALDAIAHRGDPALLSTAFGALDDDKDAVRYTAAAAAIHLHKISTERHKRAARPH